VIDQDQPAARPEDAPHLGQRPDEVRNGAKGIGAHDGVEGFVGERKIVRVRLEQLDPAPRPP
jgi:hypothetical protein